MHEGNFILDGCLAEHLAVEVIMVVEKQCGVRMLNDWFLIFGDLFEMGDSFRVMMVDSIDEEGKWRIIYLRGVVPMGLRVNGPDTSLK